MDADYKADLTPRVEKTEKQLVTYVRPNLLDNWYFVGGGSQKGDGCFPINQRGETTFTGKGYSIDRWRSATVSSTQSLYTDGWQLTTTSTTNNLYVNQFFDVVSEALVGKTVCGSILLSNGKLYSGSGVFPDKGTSEAGATVFLASIGGIGDIMVENLNDSSFTPMFTIHVNPGQNMRVAAVKLELGDTQTLAHNEGTERDPKWVLNELPNFIEEYLKCLRYLWVINFTFDWAMISVGGYSNKDKNSSRMILQTPVPMVNYDDTSVSVVGEIHAYANNGEDRTIEGVQWANSIGTYARFAPIMNSGYSVDNSPFTRLASVTRGPKIIVSTERLRS